VTEVMPMGGASRVVMLGAFLSCPLSSAAQLGSIVRVSGDEPALHHAEPHVSIEPGSHSHLLAASIAFPDSLPHRVDAFSSVDGGRTWERSRLPMPEGVAARSYIDPWTAVAPDGTEYVSVLARADAESRKAVPWVFVRAPGAEGWQHLVTIDSPGRGSFDQPKIGVRPATGELVMSVQRNGRRTERDHYTQALSVATIDPADPAAVALEHVAENNVEKNSMNVVALPDGTVLTGYYEWLRMGGSERLGLLWTLLVADTAAAPNLTTSENGMGMGWLAADPRESADRLYMVFVRGGELVVGGADGGGERWSEPVAVATVPDGQFVISAAAVDGAGRIGVVWTTPMPSPEGQVCHATWFSGSEDEGANFSAPVMLEGAPGCLTVPGTATLLAMSGEYWNTNESYARGGEYLGLVGFPEGGFYAVWTEAVDDVTQILGRRVRY
jgi:hypothetical protein